MARGDNGPTGILSEGAGPLACGIPSAAAELAGCAPLPRRAACAEPKLPDDAQDKRSVVPLEPDQWTAWLSAPVGEAAAMLVPPPTERFDLADARLTDAVLGADR